jgi:hypothetical protein
LRGKILEEKPFYSLFSKRYFSRIFLKMRAQSAKLFEALGVIQRRFFLGRVHAGAA